MAQVSMFPPQSNSPVTELAADISSTDTTVMVVAGNLLPAAPNVATIGLDELAETIYYATKNGNELSGVIRGYDGTSPKGWNAGTRIARYLTAQDISALQHNVSDHETRINGISTATINKIEPRLVDDLPALYPIGLSLFSLTLEASAPWKTAIGHSGSGQTTLVQTAKANDDQYSIVQRVTFSSASGIEAMYERSSTVNNSWNGAWIKVVSRSDFDLLSNDVTAHLADIAQDINGWRIYNNLSQLGISTGTETMTMICAAMANRSIAVLEKVTSNPATDYPAPTGLLIITKFASYRTELRFINGTASNARHWFGYYDVNITPNFTGWFEVPNKNDVPAYEQGTFTPELQFGGASTGITYSTQAGKYTRVGNVIHWAITLDLTSKGTATGNATISGLPYVNYGTPPTTVPATAIGGISGITLPSNAFGIQATIIGATNQIQLRASSSAVGVTPITDSNFSNGAVIRAEGKYFIA